MIFLAKHGDATLATGQMHLWSNLYEPDPVKTYLFTDRSIYRPGQTIRLKGVHAHADTGRNNYRTIPNKKLTIRLRDANGEEVEALEVKTNERGGFSGAFTAPKGRVTGSMRIEEGNGAVSISMEEYKRPKFQVTLNAPKIAARLGEIVSVTGKAESYAGAAIDGAEVHWRVTREARWPAWLRWCGWFYPPTDQGAKEIANGIAKRVRTGVLRLALPPSPTRQSRKRPSLLLTSPSMPMSPIPPVKRVRAQRASPQASRQ